MSELRLGTIAIPGLSALLGGVVGALLTVLLMRGKAPGPDSRPQPEPLVASTSPAKSTLDGRVASLERSLQALALKDSIARATAQAPADANPGAEPEVADVAPIVDNPVFEAAVRDVLERSEQERSVEREAQRAEWRKRSAEEWAGELAGKLRLTDIQKAKVTELATSFWERLRDVRDSDAGPPLSRQESRERVEALRKSTEAELAKVLDPSQLTSYRELDEASRLGSPRSIRASQRAGR